MNGDEPIRRDDVIESPWHSPATRRRELGWAFVLAAAMHGAALLGIRGVLSADRPPDVLPPDSGEIVVEIAFLPTPPLTPPPTVAPAPEPPPVVPEPPPVPAPEVVTAPPVPLPEVVAVAAPVVAGERAVASTEAPVPAAPAPVAKPVAVPAMPADARAADAGVPGAVSLEVPQPTALTAIAPRYPRRARLRGEEGRVTVTAEVTAEGRATRARVAASSGSPALDAAAAEAVEAARFQPAVRNGRPAEGTIALDFVFRLTD